MLLQPGRVRLVLAFAVVCAAAGSARAEPLYERLCVACHGARGDGKGPAAPWVWPRPRDFTTQSLKWGARDEDIGATIRRGSGGAMPGFGAILDDDEVARLVAVVRGWVGAAPKGKRKAIGADATGDAARGATLWSDAGCAACHGDDGRGKAADAYDLTANVLRRPHAAGAERAAIAETIAWGAGAMPGFGDTLSGEELWALVAHVDSIRYAGAAPRDVPDEAIAADRGAPIAAGTWPGATDDAAEAALFAGPIAPQGEPPESLAPAQASLSSRRCGRCHAKQVRDWTPSIHGGAFSPGFRAQLTFQRTPAKRASCLGCHAPLPEQRDDAALESEGITCAVCHVRGWTRHGPPGLAPSLLTLPGYPFQPLAIYERSDLCIGCHQLPPRQAVDGRPLLDTFREWLNGPYMQRGVQCQSCHLPNREHQFLGIHDRDTFRQGIRVEAIAGRGKTGVVSVRARLWNEGAGHYLPTTPTPAAWLEVELFDARGKPIAGAKKSLRIGRDIAFVDGAWTEKEDTRVPPGASIELAAGWKNGRVADAVEARITVRVSPDDYYQRLYRARLKSAKGDLRDLFQEAYDRTVDDEYIAEDLSVEITSRAASGGAAP